MRALVDRLLAARRKGWLGTRPVFESYRPVTPEQLAALEAAEGVEFPTHFKEFLFAAGFGDVDEELSFRAEWCKPVENGTLKGAVLFAQDTLGNFYGFVPKGGGIVFFSRSEPGYAIVSPSFPDFMEELERRHYKILDWMQTLALDPYEWQAA
jgi:hypothetical protein